MKYLGINPTKNVKNLYLENYKTLKKEFEKDTNKWKYTLCSWIGRINIIKMSILLKAIYRFRAICIKIPMMYFAELEKYSKNLYGTIKTLNGNSNLEKQVQSWRNHATWHQTVLWGHSNKTTWYWHENRHTDQWNRIKSPEINPHLYSQFIFDKGGTNIQWAKDSLFKKWSWEKWTDEWKKMRLDHLLMLHTRIISK